VEVELVELDQIEEFQDQIQYFQQLLQQVEVGVVVKLHVIQL
jgi:hypothetical protein